MLNRRQASLPCKTSMCTMQGSSGRASYLCGTCVTQGQCRGAAARHPACMEHASEVLKGNLGTRTATACTAKVGIVSSALAEDTTRLSAYTHTLCLPLSMFAHTVEGDYLGWVLLIGPQNSWLGTSAWSRAFRGHNCKAQINAWYTLFFPLFVDQYS